MKTAPRDLFDVISPPDAIDVAHEQGTVATKLFIRPPTQPGPQTPPPPDNTASLPQIQDAIRGMSLARKVEMMSARVARGLPPEPPPPPSPFVQFGNELHPIHIEAIKHAIMSAPEESRGDLISGVHDQVAQWIHDNNGKVVVNGKIEIAQNPKSANMLAGKIVNDVIDSHDQNVNKQAQLSASARPGSSQSPDSSTVPEVVQSATASSSSNAPSGSARISSNAPTSAQPPTGTPPGTAGTSTAAVAGTPLPSGTVSPQTSPASLPQSTPVSPNSGLSAQQPEIVAPGDNSAPPTGPAPEVKPDELTDIGDKDKESGREILQPKDDPEDNKKLALEAFPELQNSLSQIASQIPGANFVRIRPVKSESRIQEKIGADGKPPETLADYLGAQIAVDTPAAKDKVVNALRKNFNVVDENDKFLEGRPQKAGYPSVSMQVQLSNGSSAQVQVVAREVQEMDQTTHPLYKAGRDAELDGDNTTRDKHWAQAKQMHDDAIARFQQRNSQPQPDNPAARLQQHVEAGGFKTAGKPFSVGGKMFIGVHPPAPGILATASQPPEQAPVAPETAPEAVPAGETTTPEAPAPQEPASAQGDSLESMPPLTKGDQVSLPDGSRGEVRYMHPNMRIARVKIGKKTISMNTKDLQRT